MYILYSRCYMNEITAHMLKYTPFPLDTQRYLKGKHIGENEVNKNKLG